MLQSLRDNLKGTVAVIIIAIFAVPMVLFGVEELFVGSLGGNDVATVDDKTITRTDLQRAIYLHKQRVLAQGDVDPSSEFLQDDNLRGPVLDNLIRRAALINAAEDGKMAVSEEALWQEIVRQPQFETDGKFDRQLFRQLVANRGFTPATYLQALAEDVMLEHQDRGVRMSSFLTQQELEQLVALAQQSRSYFTVTVPAERIGDQVEVTQADVESFYQDNQPRFQEPEKVSIDYVEVNPESVAQQQEVTEEDIQQQYQQELAAFDAKPQYYVSHILLEAGDDADARAQQVQEALAQGQEFAVVAQEHSDDLGSKDSGGELGLMVEDVFPPEFEQAVVQLEEGQVSEPVETEAGIHFIRLDRKVASEAPTFADRRDSIEQELRRALAAQALVDLQERLDELTYSASDLNAAAEALQVDVQSTDLFSRSAASDDAITRHTAVRRAAFSDEVLTEGHNSPVLELPDGALVVLRVKQHEPAQVQPLAEVEEQVRQELVATRTAELLQAEVQKVKASLEAGDNPEQVAEQFGYAYAAQEGVDRSNMATDPQVMRRVFELPRPVDDAPVVGDVRDAEGNAVVIGLTAVAAGTLDSLEEPQLEAMQTQLSRLWGELEVMSYQSAIAASADVVRD